MTRHKTASKMHELYMTILPFSKKVLFILLSSLICASSRSLPGFLLLLGLNSVFVREN